jgi:hypothetical protein
MPFFFSPRQIAAASTVPTTREACTAEQTSPPLPDHRRQIRRPKAPTSGFEFRCCPASEVFDAFLGCSKEEPSFMCFKTC